MKILILNIRSGGGRRVPELLRFVDSHQPDAVVLTEWRESPVSVPIVKWAETRDMRHMALNDGNTRNGVFMAAREPYEAVSFTPSQPSAGVLMQAVFPNWLLFAAYFPIGAAKAAFFSACREAVDRHAARPILLVGDINTGNQSFDRESRGAAFACSADFDALSTGGNLFDLWRRTNGSETREWSWLSNSRNGFRIDHAFANQSFIHQFAPTCVYDHSPRSSGATDHSALIVTTK